VVILALFSTALAIAAFVAGLARVGPTLAAILSTLEPVITIGLGVAFLHETLQGNTVLGGMLILGAALGLTLARMRRAGQA
jgi:drug/metabolite transporter (DMT)-like permease